MAILDFDLEAPGQLPLLTEASTGSRFGVIDYLIHKPYLKDSLNEDRLLKDYILEIPKESKEHGSIHLMPAGGRFTENYIENLARINFDRFLRVRSNPLDDLFVDIQKAIKPDFILVDARTGFADIAGTLLFKYSALVSVHVYNNEQNKLGIASLIQQVSNIFDNIEEQPRLLWTHTSVPNWRLEQGSHEELQNYLFEQLKLIYKSSWEYIGKEYWELGLTMYYQELDGANHKQIKEFIKKYSTNGYISLKNNIINLLKPSDNEYSCVNLTKEEKKEIVKEIKYGSFIAEEDSYETYEEFEKSFLLTESIEELLNPNIYLIIGAKGTGNTGTYTYVDRYGNTVTKDWTISDEEFLDSKSLTQQQITDIMNSKNPGLVEQGFDKAVYEYAQRKGINPKVILATLAQEQGWCRNGNYKSAFGVGPGGNPIDFADGDMGGISISVNTFLKWFKHGQELQKEGKLEPMFINHDPSPYPETKAVFGENTQDWQNKHPNDVNFMEKGQYVTPVNAAMYAKLKYTPWVDFPPQGSHPLDQWHDIFRSFK